MSSSWNDFSKSENVFGGTKSIADILRVLWDVAIFFHFLIFQNFRFFIFFWKTENFEKSRNRKNRCISEYPNFEMESKRKITPIRDFRLHFNCISYYIRMIKSFMAIINYLFELMCCRSRDTRVQQTAEVAISWSNSSWIPQKTVIYLVTIKSFS